MSEKKQGVVRSWNKEKGWGVLRVGDETSLERYFCHVNNIRSGSAIPPIGSECFFEVSDKPVKREGDLQQAIKVDIVLAEVADGGGK